VGGNTRGRRRRFGSVRQLRSGRWQARYQGPDGLVRPATETFPTKTSAEQWLIRTEADILDADWIDPDAGMVPFAQYASAWIDERPGLRPKTVQLYRYLLRCHLATTETFGARTVSEIKEAHVRRWRKSLIDGGASEVTVAKAYRLLKAIMNTAVDDGLIRRNPCRLKGAGQERSPERGVLTLRQVSAVADTVDPRYRALILFAVFTSLRWGELVGLRRSDLNLKTRTVSVRRSLTELPGGGYLFGPPKSDAGQRDVVFPNLIHDALCEHLARFTGGQDDALIFTSPTGCPLRHANFRRRDWLPALAATGLTGIHFHDLRHTGNQLTASAGANLRELMDRMGHSTTRAALIYLHATREQRQAIADGVDKLAREVLGTSPDEDSGIGQSGTELARPADDASSDDQE
jgi:integrase